MAAQTQTQTQTKPTEKGAYTQPNKQQGAMVPAKNDEEAMYAAVDKIDDVVSKFREEIDQPLMRDFRKAIVTGLAIRKIREAMNAQVMDLLKSLMNTPIGFLTDRGPHAYRDDYKTPYDEETIKTCALEAIIRGVLWTGNCFNILAGRCYITKEGYYYLLSKLPGLTDLNVVPSVPVIREGHTVLRVAASWKMEGVAAMLKDHEGKPGRNFVITVNKSMGPDAIVGKAYRKAYKCVWDQIHGCESTDDSDDDATEAPAPRSGTDELKQKLAAGAPGNSAGSSTANGETFSHAVKDMPGPVKEAFAGKEEAADSASGGGSGIDPNDDGINEPGAGLFKGGNQANDASRM